MLFLNVTIFFLLLFFTGYDIIVGILYPNSYDLIAFI